MLKLFCYFTQGDNYQTVSDIPPEKKMVVLFNAVQALANVHRYYWVWRYSSGWEIKMDHQSCEGYWEKMVGALIAVPACLHCIYVRNVIIRLCEYALMQNRACVWMCAECTVV